MSQGSKRSKIGRNRAKCASYRLRIGKPNGPGKDGTKAGSKRAS